MTFVLNDEDHTLGNALRWMLTRKLVLFTCTFNLCLCLSLVCVKPTNQGFVLTAQTWISVATVSLILQRGRSIFGFKPMVGNFDVAGFNAFRHCSPNHKCFSATALTFRNWSCISYWQFLGALKLCCTPVPSLTPNCVLWCICFVGECRPGAGCFWWSGHFLLTK